MKRHSKRCFGIAMVLVMLIGCLPGTVMASSVDDAIADTAAYLIKTVKNPQVGSIGGEWAVLGLARWGGSVPDGYFDNYYNTLVKYVQDCEGKLHDKKYTEYSRVVLALTAIGADPTDVGGYNLLTPLGDFEKTIWQGINGPVYALIALDSGNYLVPENKDAAVQATREMYIEEILRRQLTDGGFSLVGGTASAKTYETSDPDITAMTLQALAKYQDRDDVKKVTEEALVKLSEMQDDDGGYSSWRTNNSESVVQTIVALCELGIPIDDQRFVKNGKTTVDNLLTYSVKGEGFLHSQTVSGSNLMATEQAFYGLVAVRRAESGEPTLYRMSDSASFRTPAVQETQKTGLAGKNGDVTPAAVTKPGTTFEDIVAHVNQPAIEALASRGIINGKEESRFDPEATMTRAEFAAIIVQALGLPEKKAGIFSDVTSGAWYAGYVGAAYEYGIVNGVTADTFNPQGTITRQEAAVMTAKAAAICGMDTAMDSGAVRDMLAQFTDYTQSAAWAQESLAFCYEKDILSQTDIEILPAQAIKRCEIAEMIFRMLGEAKLL